MPLLYARRSWRLVRQITADVAVVAWSVSWALIATVVHAAVAAVARPARATADALREVSTDFRSAADAAGSVPALGEQLRRPFEASVERLGAVIAAADQQVAAIEQLALILGWLTFLVPVGLLVAVWLPIRLRFIRRMRAAQTFLTAGAGLDLFALRSLTHQPLPVLARISDDPVSDWRAGDPRVVQALADLELSRCGLRTDSGDGKRDRPVTPGPITTGPHTPGAPAGTDG